MHGHAFCPPSDQPTTGRPFPVPLCRRRHRASRKFDSESRRAQRAEEKVKSHLVSASGAVNCCWLVVWNMAFILPFVGNNSPNWLSYFSTGVETTNQSIMQVSSTISVFVWRSKSWHQWTHFVFFGNSEAINYQEFLRGQFNVPSRKPCLVLIYSYWGPYRGVSKITSRGLGYIRVVQACIR